MGREFELKYRTDRETLTAMKEAYSGFVPIQMQTTYYDTPDRDLGDRRWTLRRRYENGVSVCTVKTPAADGSRGEWETEAEAVEDAIALLLAAGAPEELASFAAKGVLPVCGARFTRQACRITLEQADLELALDAGFLLGGGRELPFFEVEVELKAGSETAAVAFARDLADRFRLIPEPKSKVQRALELAKT